jgi:serine/threonine protein kinase
MDRSADEKQSSGSQAKPGLPFGPSRLLGTVISDRYQVLEVIATTGMSTLYKGQHVHMRKHVAIKVLDAQAEKLPELITRFQREAIVGAHLQHPNIAQATDFGQLPDGSHFLILEYVPGVTLGKIIADGPVPTTRAVRITRQLASALQAAHEAGVVHRDVKPGNVMLAAESNDAVKLIDFGFAKVRLSRVPSVSPLMPESGQSEQLSTAVGVVLGTVAYMAPEAALGMPAVDERSDLYAVGLILYELLAGRHPFDATDPGELFMQQRTMAPPPIGASPGVAVPPALEAVVMKLLEKDPEQRYQRAAELISVLDTTMLSMDLGTVPDIDRSSTEDADAHTLSSSDLLSQSPPPVSGNENVETPAPAPVARPSIGLKESVSRRASALFQSLPPDGRFPRWAYIGLPVIGILVVALVIVVAAGLPERSPSPPPPEKAAAEPSPPPVEPTAKPAPAVAPPAPAAIAPAEPAATASAVERMVVDTSGTDAAGFRTRLRNAARQKDWIKGGEAVVGLLKLEPRAFRDYDVANAARAVAVGLDQAGGDPAAQFFAALTNDAGQSGLDLLYDVSRFRPATKAAKTALDILRRPEVMGKASTPLRVLVDLREASCIAKRDQFAKVGEQGDDRALFELELLRDTECPRKTDACCYKDNKALAAAIKTLKSRLATPPSVSSAPL